MLGCIWRCVPIVPGISQGMWLVRSDSLDLLERSFTHDYHCSDGLLYTARHRSESTLRNWLRHSNMQFAAHPTDARLKCLTEEQVQQLATLHARPLPSPATACPTPISAAPPSDLAQGPAEPRQESETLPVQAANPLSTPLAEEADLVKKLSCLETKVTTLQEQLAQLALELLHERSLRYERRLSALEALMPQRLDASASQQDLPATVAAGQAEGPSTQGRSLHPAELRARSRVIPLIEYGAHGTYVVICPKARRTLAHAGFPGVVCLAGHALLFPFCGTTRSL